MKKTILLTFSLALSMVLGPGNAQADSCQQAIQGGGVFRSATNPNQIVAILIVNGERVMAWIPGRSSFNGICTSSNTFQVYFNDDPGCKPCTGQIDSSGNRIDWNNGTHWVR